MIKPQPKNSPIYNTMVKVIEAKKANTLQSELVRWGEQRGAAAQLALALTAQKVADDLRGINHIPSLADDIIAQQSHKIAQYGDKAFPLSEKQIAVIVRDVI